MEHHRVVQNYLANLGVFIIKLHNIHWNVVGEQFLQIHNLTEEIYNEFFADFDAVAELLKTKNVMPLSTMADYLKNSTIEDIEPKAFSTSEALSIVKKDLEIMKDLSSKIRNSADQVGDFETVALFEDYSAFLGKYLWFINAMLN